MKEKNFNVRLDMDRWKKQQAYRQAKRLTKRAFLELTIDEIRLAADSTTYRKSK